MQGLINFLNIVYEYMLSLLGINFLEYAGELPIEFIDMYQYVTEFFKVVVVFFFLYMCFNFLYFIFSLGYIKK